MDRLGVDFLSMLGTPPIAHVQIAAALGCAQVSTALCRGPAGPDGGPDWSLREDAALRRDLVRALDDAGITLSQGEGLCIMPGHDVAAHAADLDLFAGLGARGIAAFVMEPDPTRGCDQFGRLVELAAARGLRTHLEFVPFSPVATLDAALALIAQAGSHEARLLIDAIHFFRSGGTIAALAALDPARIGHAQLCDAPTRGGDDYFGEVMTARRVPGAGELPLAAFVAALPADVSIGLEIPDVASARAGISRAAFLAPAVAAARRLGA